MTPLPYLDVHLTMTPGNKLACATCLFVLFIIFSSGCKFAELGKPAIVKNGRPCADIVISENPPRAVKLAALELQLYIQKISGAVLPVASSPQTNFAFHIYVGKSAWTDKLNIYSEGLKHGDRLGAVGGATQLGVSVGMGLASLGLGGPVGPAMVLGCGLARVGYYLHHFEELPQ